MNKGMPSNNYFPDHELHVALKDFEYYKTTDPRDKIYALLNISASPLGASGS
jgi:hypothetical protein